MDYINLVGKYMPNLYLSGYMTYDSYLNGARVIKMPLSADEYMIGTARR